MLTVFSPPVCRIIRQKPTESSLIPCKVSFNMALSLLFCEDQVLVYLKQGNKQTAVKRLLIFL